MESVEGTGSYWRGTNMREIYGDLFGHNDKGPYAICITTNGYVDRAGCNVMGKGTAGEAKRRWPGIEKILGRRIQEKGNHVHLLTKADTTSPYLELNWLSPRVRLPYHIVSFPTKPGVVHDASDLITHYRKANEGHTEDLNLPGWMAKSNLELISQSAWELKALVDRMEWQSCVLPYVGAGAGELNFETQVKPLLVEALDDRFYLISKR